MLTRLCLPIETERMILRRFRETALEDLYGYLSRSQVVAYEPYKPLSRQEAAEELQERIESREMIAVKLKASQKVIGNLYLGERDFDTLELGYVFHDQYWGQGYASESCRKLIETAFENGVHRIYAECDPENPNSWRLLERLGFEREAHLKQNVYFWKDRQGRPIWKDTYIYASVNRNVP